MEDDNAGEKSGWAVGETEEDDNAGGETGDVSVEGIEIGCGEKNIVGGGSEEKTDQKREAAARDLQRFKMA